MDNEKAYNFWLTVAVLKSHTNLIQILEERRKWTFRTKSNSLFTVDLTFHLPLCLQTDAEPLGCCAAGCVGAHRRRPTPGAAGVRKKIFNDLQLHLLDSSFSLFCLRDTTVTVWFMRRGLTIQLNSRRIISVLREHLWLTLLTALYGGGVRHSFTFPATLMLLSWRVSVVQHTCMQHRNWFTNLCCTTTT